MAMPKDLEESEFRSEARDLAALASWRGELTASTPEVAPQRVMWFWEEVGRSPEVDSRLWRCGAKDGAWAREAVEQGRQTGLLKEPIVVQCMDEGQFVAENGTLRPAARIERARGRSFVALIDAAGACGDPEVCRFDRGDPSLVRDSESYVRFASDTLVRFALSGRPHIEVYLSQPQWGTASLPSFAPDLRLPGEGVYSYPIYADKSAHRRMASASLGGIVRAFLGAPTNLFVMNGNAGTRPGVAGRTRSLLFTTSRREVGAGFEGLRRFVGAAMELPARTVTEPREHSRFVHTTWVGEIDGAPVWCHRSAEMRPGVVDVVADESDETTIRAWAKRNGYRELR
jgi:hypothetical protein